MGFRKKITAITIFSAFLYSEYANAENDPTKITCGEFQSLIEKFNNDRKSFEIPNDSDIVAISAFESGVLWSFLDSETRQDDEKFAVAQLRFIRELKNECAKNPPYYPRINAVMNAIKKIR